MMKGIYFYSAEKVAEIRRGMDEEKKNMEGREMKEEKRKRKIRKKGKKKNVEEEKEK